MPKRCWSLVVTIGIFLSLGGPSQGDEAQNLQQAGPAPQQPAQDAPPPIRVQIVEDQSNAEASRNSDLRAEQREQDDLAAQQGMEEAARRMADYTFVQTISVAFGTILLVGTLWLTIKANQAATRAAVAAEQQASSSDDYSKRELRAYVGVKSCKAKLDLKTGIFTVVVTCPNSGKTPAKDLQAWVMVGLRTFDGFTKEANPVGEFVSKSPLFPEGRIRLIGQTPAQTREGLQQAVQEKYRLWAYGRIEYLDIYGCRRFTNFRWSGELNNQFRMTVEPEGNDYT